MKRTLCDQYTYDDLGVILSAFNRRFGEDVTDAHIGISGDELQFDFLFYKDAEAFRELFSKYDDAGMVDPEAEDLASRIFLTQEMTLNIINELLPDMGIHGVKYDKCAACSDDDVVCVFTTRNAVNGLSEAVTGLAGMSLRTPRFMTVTIDAVFTTAELMRQAGYTEPTHNKDRDFVIQGKSIGNNRMVFAAAPRES